MQVLETPNTGCTDYDRSSKLAAALKTFEESLSQDETTKFRAISGTTPDTNSVVQLMKDLERSDGVRKSRIAASRVEGMLVSVQQFSNVADAYAGGDHVGALVWGSLKLFLLFASNFAEYFDKISTRVAQLSAYCPRLAEYETLFHSSERLQLAIADFYAVVVVFCTKAVHSIREKGMTRSIKAIWRPFQIEFRELEEALINAREEVKEELQLASEQASYDLRLVLRDEIREAGKHRQDQRTDLAKSEAFRSQLLSNLEDKKRRDIDKILHDQEREMERLLQKIPSHNYRAALQRVQRRRLEGTCQWLFDKPEFQEWFQRKGPRHLWCYGIPGCGKSVTMGATVDYLQQKLQGQQRIKVIYYFFDYHEPQTLQIRSFLRCILHQMLQSSPISPSLQKRLESHFRDGVKPSINALINLYIDFCGESTSGCLLIDGADECTECDRRGLKLFLKRTENLTDVRIIATSLPELDLQRCMRSCQILQIKRQDIDTDINVFTRHRIQEAAEDELSSCSPSQLNSIQEALYSLSDGMFLWVDLQINEICTSCDIYGTPSEIPRLLETLPRDLETVYRNALVRFSRRNDQQAELAKKVFQWVICGRKRLTVGELEEAISITSDQKIWQEPHFRLDFSKLCKITGSLLDFDQPGGTISLAHRTVSDFLFNCSELPGLAPFAIKGQAAEELLADSCLTYLCFANFQKSLIQRADPRLDPRLDPALNQPIQIARTVLPRPLHNLVPHLSKTYQYGKFNVLESLRDELSIAQRQGFGPAYQLLGYARRYWYEHCRFLQKDNEPTLHKIRRFIKATHIPNEFKPWEVLQDKPPKLFWQLFSWSLMKGHSMMFRIWQDIVQSDEKEYWDHFWIEDGFQVLSSACTNANIEQVELILSAKDQHNLSCPSSDDLSYELIKVSRLGHLKIVERLLNGNTINVEVRVRGGPTSLQAAAGGGHLAVVERLLQEHANVNATAAETLYGRTALQAAAEGGHLEVVERLLQKGADVNSSAPLTALQAAARGGHLAIVERLLQEGADVNTTVGQSERTALQAAAEGGNLLVIERLLQERANVNTAADFDGRTALQAAAEGGHLSVVERLLQEHADVHADAARFSGRTALQAAAEGGHVLVVERLLQNHADVNAGAARFSGRTALQAAAGSNHLTVIELLLQEGADINAVAAEDSGRTALQAAAEGGHLTVVQRLLQERADVNAAAAKYCGQTALRAAAGNGHLAVVEQLLQEHADVNAPAAEEYGGRTALQAAAESGHLAVVERLLQENANVNTADLVHNGRTALQAASEGGHLAVVERLLQKGAKVNAAAAERDGRTALQAASEGGHVAVVERLLQQRADVNAEVAQDGGQTALKAAAKGDYLAVVERLLQQHADVNATAGHGGTPLQVAETAGHLAIANRLLASGARR